MVEYSAGIVTAYGSAKRAGYTGTYEEFCRQQAEYAQNASAVEQAKQTAVSSAQSASQSAGQAQTASGQAELAKQTAVSSAQLAGQSATDAHTAETNAQGYAQSASASAGSAQQSAQTAQAVLESIPEDYSELSEDVDQLKADLGDPSQLNIDDANDIVSAINYIVSILEERGYILEYAFSADFSGEHPLSSQFYTWAGREYGNAIYDSIGNIVCNNGVVDLTSVYDSLNNRWLIQMLTTSGIFESDNFTLEFNAMFSGVPGSWQNVITYGTGTHWTNGLYSDGLKWPSGGEIDAFEQAGGYSSNPNTFTPTFHYGAGTNSGYPHTHEYRHFSNGLSLPLDQWASYKFELENGVAKIYVNGSLLAQEDGSNIVVNNNYLWNYHPFLKPQAFYIDGSCASDSQSIDTSNEYHFYVKDFKIKTRKNDAICSGLSIFPQMWAKGTSLVFPIGAEFYLDREYTPSNTANKACIWSSSDETVATVCQGFVKTIGVGTATITATCGNATATYDVVCSNNASIPCAGIAIDSDSIEMVGQNSTDIANVISIYPSYTTDTITLTSSDNTIATVSGTTISSLGNEGTAVITVVCGNASDTITVSVSSGIIYESDIQVTDSAQTLYNESISYDATQTYSFQYTFSSLENAPSSTSRNINVGPVNSNNAIRNGAIQYLVSSSQWYVLRALDTLSFTPVDGSVLTIVYNFATDRLSAYLDETTLFTNYDPGRVYFENTAKIIYGRGSSGMTIAPTHIKIAIGDLH